MDKSIYIVSLVTLIAAIVFHALTQPMLSEIKTKREYLGSLNSVLEDSDKLQRARDEILASYNSIDVNTRNRISESIPRLSNSAVIGTYSLVQYVASISGVDVDSINLKRDDSRATQDNLAGYVATIGISDISYQTYLEFTRVIEGWSRVVSVTGVDLTSLDSGNLDLVIELELIFSK